MLGVHQAAPGAGWEASEAPPLHSREGGHTVAILTGRKVGVDCAPIKSCVAHEGAGGDIPG